MSTWISDYDMRRLQRYREFRSIVSVDAHGITEKFLIEIQNGGDLLALTHKGQRLVVPTLSLSERPNLSIYLGKNLDGKMVRATLERFPRRG